MSDTGCQQIFKINLQDKSCMPFGLPHVVHDSFVCKVLSALEGLKEYLRQLASGVHIQKQKVNFF